MGDIEKVRNNEIENFTEEQILILQLSDKDIESGKLIPDEELARIDLEWLEAKGS